MNVALRLLMRKSAVTPPAIPLRVKRDTRTGSTTQTLTFDEATALDSTHLLVCIVTQTGNNAVTATGWVNQQSTQALGSSSSFIFSRQGDGSTNSITLTVTAGITQVITLVAFSGFVSATKLSGASGADSTTTMDCDPGNPGGTGVAVLGAKNASGSFTGSWSGSWALLAPDVSSNHSHAWVLYSGSSVATSRSRTTASGVYATCIFDLT